MLRRQSDVSKARWLLSGRVEDWCPGTCHTKQVFTTNQELLTSSLRQVVCGWGFFWIIAPFQLDLKAFGRGVQSSLLSPTTCYFILPSFFSYIGCFSLALKVSLTFSGIQCKSFTFYTGLTPHPTPMPSLHANGGTSCPGRTFSKTSLRGQHV